jgi:hypothetical protein
MSAVELSSEQSNLLELSFSDEDSRSVDALNGVNEFELAAQEFYLIPMLCTYLDQYILKNDFHEVSALFWLDFLSV